MCSVCKEIRRDVFLIRCVVCRGEEFTVTAILSSCIDLGIEILPELSHISFLFQLTSKTNYAILKADHPSGSPGDSPALAVTPHRLMEIRKQHTVMKCTKCGAENAPETKFCLRCGQELAASPAVVQTVVGNRNIQLNLQNIYGSKIDIQVEFAPASRSRCPSRWKCARRPSPPCWTASRSCKK